MGCANGTAALFLALRVLGIKEDDEVITTTNSFIATAEA
ncbi:MAG: DegT/DnrJ/EryC1/StrS family aminotransferase, partial [Oligoflexia bacterium]|nr:DegT/DnrJ/EryC1/StrS family aminotransferase [Oligoflexia bacterium]